MNDDKYQKNQIQKKKQRILKYHKYFHILSILIIFYLVFISTCSIPDNLHASLPSSSSSSTSDSWLSKVSKKINVNTTYLKQITTDGIDIETFLTLFGFKKTSIPNQIERVVIDIGWQTIGEFEGRPGSNPFAKGYDPAPDRLLIGFEANPKTWTEAEAVKESDHGQMKCDRDFGCVIVLPLAVASGGKPLQFNAASATSDTTGCDSILSMASPKLSIWSLGDWPCYLSNDLCAYMGTLHSEGLRRCKQKIPPVRGTFWTPLGEFLGDMKAALTCIKDHEKDNGNNYNLRSSTSKNIVTVPSIEARQLIEFIPKNLEISLLKVDAQGADLLILKTMGKQRERVKKIQIEVQDLEPTDRLIMYEGGATHIQATKELASWGFVEKRCELQSCAIGEMNCIYENEA